MGKPLKASASRLQFALINGTDILEAVDGRGWHARRYRDLTQLLISDLGGEEAGLSTAQVILVRRAATLVIELERMETIFAEKGQAAPTKLLEHQRCTNTVRRLFESLGIHQGRIARNVTPSLQQYLSGRKDNGHSDGRLRTIDHKDDA